MEIRITRERPDTPEASALIAELDDYLNVVYENPGDENYGDSAEKLVEKGVAFFVVRCDGQAAGCGGLLLHEREWAEIKRVYVRPAFRGLKLGRRLLQVLEEHALENGIRLVRLESGVRQPEALALYEKCGYRSIPAFPPYVDDELGVYYEKRLGERSDRP
jgi:GNAT superfamily N-acetyltransferase